MNESPLDDHGIRERIIQAARRQYHDPDHHSHADMALAAARAALLAVRAEIEERYEDAKAEYKTMWTIDPADCDYEEGRSDGVGDALARVQTLLASLDPQETTEEQHDQGGHVPHGGRSDLEPAASPQLPHDGE